MALLGKGQLTEPPTTIEKSAEIVALSGSVLWRSSEAQLTFLVDTGIGHLLVELFGQLLAQAYVCIYHKNAAISDISRDLDFATTYR